MTASKKTLQFFSLQTSEGITVVTFDRPPVNAVSTEVLREIKSFTEIIQASDESRVVVLTAPSGARAWCAGADVNEFVPLDYDSRMQRFALIEECLPRLYELDRPVIAAINGPAVGFGVVLATYCDIRIISQDAFIALPEIDRGVLAGSLYLARIGMPQGKIREITFTGRRFMAEELRGTGLFDHIVADDQVLATALEIAEIIARKPLAALKANKTTSNAAERLSWEDAYAMTIEASARLTATRDAKEGIRAFLEKRDPVYSDR